MERSGTSKDITEKERGSPWRHHTTRDNLTDGISQSRISQSGSEIESGPTDLCVHNGEFGIRKPWIHTKQTGLWERYRRNKDTPRRGLNDEELWEIRRDVEQHMKLQQWPKNDEPSRENGVTAPHF